MRLAAAVARWALRAYAVTTGLMVGLGAVAIAAGLPLARLGDPGAPRLRLPVPPAAEFGLAYSRLAWSPADAQWGALVALARMLLGLAVAVAVVAVVTILALAATRASRRRVEIAVRRAVGASRRGLRVSGMLEGAMLAVAACLAGGAIAVVGSHALAASWPGLVLPGRTWSVLAIGGGLIIATVLGACMPVVRLPRATRVRGGRPLPRALLLPTLQLGISLMMLVVAAALGREAAHVSPVSPGGAASTGSLFDVRARGRLAQRAVHYAALMHRLNEDPSVDLVSLSSAGALFGVDPVDFVTTDCGRCAQGGLRMRFRVVPAALAVVSADTFRAMRARVLRGRGFADTDGWAAPRVAVVNQALATSHFEHGDAVGRSILLGADGGRRWFTVVGVVEDRRPAAIGGAFQPPFSVYLNVLQQPPRAAELLVHRRSSRDRPGRGRVATTGAAAAGDDAVSIVARGTEASRRAATAAPLRWFARVARLEGLVALVVATLGTFAVTDRWVTALLPELAVRRAVGARRRHVVGYVLARAAAIAIGGTAVGWWLAGMTAGTVAAAFGAAGAPEPALILRSAAWLVTAVLAGALPAAWRAARVAPAAGLARLES